MCEASLDGTHELLEPVPCCRIVVWNVLCWRGTSNIIWLWVSAVCGILGDSGSKLDIGGLIWIKENNKKNTAIWHNVNNQLRVNLFGCQRPKLHEPLLDVVAPAQNLNIYYEVSWVNSSPPGQNGCHFTDDIWDAFSWMKNFASWLKFHWSFLLRVQLTITQHWFRLSLSVEWATSYYLNQCWLSSLRHIFRTKGRWVDTSAPGIF